MNHTGAVEAPDPDAAAGSTPRARESLVIEAIALLGGGGIGLEFALLPVGLKGAFKLAQHRGRFQGRQAHVPLQAVEQGGSREVGGADVGGAGATGAMKQPGLGVQAGAAGVSADNHLGGVGLLRPMT